MGYHAPTDLNEALDRLAAGGVRIVAGGTDHFAARQPGPEPVPLLDVTRVAALRGITRQDDGWRIGAATSWTDIARADLPPAFDGLRAAAREVGGIQIQNAGTVAGNLCNASPAADGVPPLLTLAAEIELRSVRGTRRLPLSEFITGPRRTALAADEMVTAIHVPAPPEGARGAFHKLGARRYLVISITMSAALIGLDAAGRITVARVAVGACSAVAQRLTALESDLIGRRPGEVALAPAHLEPLAPIDDMRAGAAYRSAAAAEQVARVIRTAGEAHG
ncbi:CO or xanthine dehydrogenase, FAD-binding subunit [Cribrihabitans marinus]|uniref:CO or xanthine dehydrogenase, FAD-binding subunit n=1 Tax=Cribrihabitans marinus TaxID=1227549 RepID=A0A1H6SJQ1_9RHOB|nr:FAD binding domain-containing protein [Cribrihabitans marinus]GGH23264.1 xanthine dehydrogenase [Cribrihabitans marinus]SEI68188.1 CO or xanthine dehydrogenase, FAD-binding subunit [Cribrihabitans marinus]